MLAKLLNDYTQWLAHEFIAGVYSDVIKDDVMLLK